VKIQLLWAVQKLVVQAGCVVEIEPIRITPENLSNQKLNEILKDDQLLDCPPEDIDFLTRKEKVEYLNFWLEQMETNDQVVKLVQTKNDSSPRFTIAFEVGDIDEELHPFISDMESLVLSSCGKSKWVPLFNLVISQLSQHSQKTLLQSFKKHMHSLQDEEVQKVVVDDKTCYAYILNFFDHHCGDHANCISEACEHRGRADYQTEEFIKQIHEIRDKFMKHITLYQSKK